MRKQTLPGGCFLRHRQVGIPVERMGGKLPLTHGPSSAMYTDMEQECNFKHINLTEIHRQSDKKFISILQKIRTGMAFQMDYFKSPDRRRLILADGVILKPHANILLNHTSETEGAIQLFARRDDVDRVNNENIAKLPAQAITYKCVDHFDWKTHHREEASLEKNTRPGDDGTLLALV